MGGSWKRWGNLLRFSRVGSTVGEGENGLPGPGRIAGRTYLADAATGSQYQATFTGFTAPVVVPLPIGPIMGIQHFVGHQRLVGVVGVPHQRRDGARSDVQGGQGAAAVVGT